MSGRGNVVSHGILLLRQKSGLPTRACKRAPIISICGVSENSLVLEHITRCVLRDLNPPIHSEWWKHPPKTTLGNLPVSAFAIKNWTCAGVTII